MQTYVNPFNPQTEVGSSLQNIATAMFSNNMDKKALAESRHQHAELYRILGEKHLRDMASADALDRARSPDAMDENVAWATGTPLAAIRNARSYLRGDLPQGSMPPAGPVMRNIGDTMFAVRTGMADKTVNANEIAKAIAERAALRNREDVMSGVADPTLVSQAHYSTSGKAPFDNMGDKGTFNVLTGGDQSLNAIGTEAAGAEHALGAARTALANQRDLETRTGVKIGPPVAVNDPEYGTIFTAPSAAVGRPAAKPESASSTALNDARTNLALARAGTSDARTGQILGGTSTPLVPIFNNGELIYVPRQDAIGETPGPMPRAASGAKRTSLQKSEADAMAAALSTLAGGSMDPNMKVELTSQATTLATDPASAYYRNPIGAAQAVWKGNASRVQRTPWYLPGGMSLAPNGSPQNVGGLPPSAQGRLREGVQTTFANGQVWSLVDGKPARMK